MTLSQVQEAQNSVWVQFSFGEWALLRDFNGDTFDSLDLAKDFVRDNFKSNQVGLSNFEQASVDNAMWDNL